MQKATRRLRKTCAGGFKTGEKMKQPAYKVKRITPRAMRLLKKHGLLANDNGEFVANITEVYLNEPVMREMCEAIFEDDFSNIDFENDLDLEMVNRGLRDFLQRALGA